MKATAIVCGAGIAGLTLASRLAHHGWDVTVVERARGPRPQGYMIDFFGPGFEAAEAMGLTPRIQDLGARITEGVYVDEKGHRRGSVDFRRFADSVRGSLVSIMRPDLELVLRESLPASVDLRYRAELTGVRELDNGVRVTLADNTELDADLLVGADGIHSTVRGLVFGGEQRYMRYLGFHTAAYVFDNPAIHELLGRRVVMTDTIDRQMAFYGTRDGRVTIFTVHRGVEPTVPKDPRSELRRVFDGMGFLVPEALELCPEPEDIYYDQVAQIRMPRWSSGRVVLLGDACAAVSLLAGQGASLGVGGGFVLAETLAHATSVLEGLARFENQWRPVVAERQRAGRTSAKWFLPHTRARLSLRRVALRAAELPGVNQLIATALTGKSTPVVRHYAALADAAPPR